MTAPRYPWIAQADADFGADDSLTELKIRTLNHNLDHVQDSLYDRATHIPKRLHDHDGINSALIQMPSPNLVERASLSTESDGLGGEWSKFNATFGTYTGDAGAALGTVEGAYISKPLMNADLNTDECIRTGARFTVSMFVKQPTPAGPGATGKINFGITDNSVSTFLTGCKGVILESLLTATYQRFYFSCLTPDISDRAYFLARVTPACGSDIRIDCVSVTLGPVLGWWHPADYDPAHYLYKLISQNVPCWDYAIGMTDVTRLVPS